MKQMAKRIVVAALALALVLAQAAMAEPDPAIKGIFDAMLAEGSGYSNMKLIYADYMPNATYEETLADDSFTIGINNTGYVDGSWTFTKDGDFLTTTVGTEDFNGAAMALYAINAAGVYLGMDPDIISGYVNGVLSLDIENDNIILTTDEAAGTESYRINIAGPWDMKELDQITFNDSTLFFDALTDEDISYTGSIGKFMVVANGNVDEDAILLGEYGELDETARKSLVNIVGILQPEGWEAFTADYTEMAEADAEGYSVKLNVDAATVGQIIDDAPEGYSFAVAHFGK